jgi:hypothetical protein
MTILPIDRLTVGAYNKDENKLVIVAVNDKAKGRRLTLGLEEFSPEGTLEAVRTSGSLENAEHWTSLPERELDGTALSAELLPYSITTFILKTKK